jgi:hypothetical protein
VSGSGREEGRTAPLAALAFAAALTVLGVVVSRPLVAELGRALPLGADAGRPANIFTGVMSDSFQLYYQLWLVRDGVLGPAPFLQDPYQFRLDSPRPNGLQTFPPLGLPFLALSPLGGPEVAYGLLVLLTFPASGLLAAGLIRHLTACTAAAGVIGAGIAVLPSRLVPLFGGHPAGFVLALALAGLWGLDRALVVGCPWGGLAGGLALFGLATSEPQYTYLLTGVLVAHAALRWRGLVLPGSQSRRALALFILGAAGGVAWLWLFRQQMVAGSIVTDGRDLETVRRLSPGLASLTRPTTYGGLGLALLAVVGLVGAKRGPGRGLRLVYAAWLLVGLILGLGATLPTYTLLYTHVPLFALIRNPAKFHLLLAVGAAVLAGYGARDVLARLPARGRPVAALMLGGLVVVTAVPWHGIKVVRLPDPPPLAGLQPEPRKVLYLPLWPGDRAESSSYLYFLTRTRVPALNGYSALVPRTYRAEVMEPLWGLNVGDFGPHEQDALRRLGVTHLVLDARFFPAKVSPFPARFTANRLAASPSLEPVPAAWRGSLFRVRDGQAGPGPVATTPLGVFFEAESLAHQVGQVADDPTASGGRVVRAPAAGPPGFLVYGEHEVLPRGSYRAAFRVKGSGLRVDVSAEVGREILARRDVPPLPDWQIVTLPFDVHRARPLEFRVERTHDQTAAVDWVLVTFADRPEPEWAYEVEDLPGRNADRADAAASGGRAVYLEPLPETRGNVTRGPARLFPAGRYRLTLRARVDAPGRGPLLELRVTEPGGRALSARIVTADETVPGTYHPLALDFTIPEPRVLEVPIKYLGGPGVFLDRIEISRVDGPAS